MRPVILFLCLLFASNCFACGNEYYSTPDLPLTKGKMELSHLLNYPHDNTYPYWHHGFGDDTWTKRSALSKKISPGSGDITGSLSWEQLEKALANDKLYKHLSDYAWHELRIGDKQKAVRLLEALYKKHPEEYNIVANLGTAYEVTGKNKMALQLIQKAVGLNPASHFGSEWIHVNILEQKLKTHPEYTAIIDLKNKSISKLGQEELMKQIAYQLHERISFINAPDPIVGQLVHDFAELTAINYSAKEAAPFFTYASTYDAAISKKNVENNPGATEKNATVVSRKKNNLFPVMLGVGVLALGSLGYFTLRKKRNAPL